MRKNDQKPRQGGGGGGGGRNGGSNGFIPTSFRSISSYLRIVSSGASTVASTVRSAASAASTIVDRDTDAVADQVLWAGFDNLECEGDLSRRVLLLGYQYGFQVWDVEDAHNVRNIISRYDGAVSFIQALPKPTASKHSLVEYENSRPLLVICADGAFSAGGNGHGGLALSGSNNIKNSHDQLNGGSVPTAVWFYSVKAQSYVKELKFRSAVYSVRCSSRIVAVLQAAQVHCFDVATLQREYTILTNPIVTSSSRFENIGLGPLAVGPRWIAYSGSVVDLQNTRVSPQHLTHPRAFATNGSNGSIVAHYAKQSSKQLAVGIVTLGDIGYKKLSRYYSDFLPDGNNSQQLSDPGRKDRGTLSGRSPDTANVGMVIVRDVVSKSVISQFKAHDSPIASLCFDPSGTLLVTASVHGHNFNVFRIMPGLVGSSHGPENYASCVHLYRLQRGFTNAVIQDISFSMDSYWIMISSSRGTTHLFSISPSGGPVNIQSAEDSFTATNMAYKYNHDVANVNMSADHVLPNSGPQMLNQQILCASGPPVTLSALSRIRNGNGGWRNMVSGAAVAASCRTNSYSGVIASAFYNCKGNNSNTDLGSKMSKYHMLVFSSGSVIQYALRLSSEVDSATVVSGSNTAYESSLDYDSRLVVEPIQKWNVCHKQNRREREENVDIYGENGHTDSRKVFPERSFNRNNGCFDGMSKVKKENASLEERNHVYISEAELLMHQTQIPLWARTQIYFQSLTIDAVIMDMEDNSKGEFEIEKIPTHTIEARARNLIPAVGGPNVEMTRYEHEKRSRGSSSNPNGNEESGADAPKMAIDDTNGNDFGFVNKDCSLKSHTRLGTVYNREHSVSELVNNHIDQKLEKRYDDEGDGFD